MLRLGVKRAARFCVFKNFSQELGIWDKSFSFSECGMGTKYNNQSVDRRTGNY